MGRGVSFAVRCDGQLFPPLGPGLLAAGLPSQENSNLTVVMPSGGPHHLRQEKGFYDDSDQTLDALFFQTIGK